MNGIGFAEWGAAAGPETAALAGAGATLRRVSVPAGHVAAPHHHGFEQFLVVLDGNGTLRGAAGDACPLRPGVVLHLPAGTVHGAVFDTAMILIEVNLPEAPIAPG